MPREADSEPIGPGHSIPSARDTLPDGVLAYTLNAESGWLRRALAVLSLCALVLVMVGPTPVSGQESDTPGRPTNLTGTVAHDAVTLTWDAPTDSTVTGYQILRLNRETDAPGDFDILVENTGSADTSYTDSDVDAGAQYVYRVKARNGDALSGQSNYFDANLPAAPEPPAGPTGLTGTVKHDRVSLTWADPQDDSITGYQILRRNRDTDATGDFDILVEDTGSADTAYTDTAVESGTRYGYRVKARKGDLLSASSGYFDANVPQPPQVTASFEASNYTALEGDSVTVAVVLDQDPERDVTVEIVPVNQGGATDADYSGVPQEVVFAKGETRKEFTFTATDDEEDDDGESVLLRIGAALPDRVSAGSANEATVSITDDDGSTSEVVVPVDEDATRDGAIDLGDITAISRNADALHSINQDGDAVDYFRFTITEPRHVVLGIRELDADASVTLENAQGEAIQHSATPGAGHLIAYYGTLLEGSYYMRVEATGAGANEYRLVYGTRAPDPDRVTELRAEASESQGDAKVVVNFEQSAYVVTEGQQVVVKVTLDVAPGESVEIPIIPSNQNELTDSDYSGVPETVTFGDDDLEALFTVTTSANGEIADGRGLALSIGTDLPDNVTLGPIGTTTLFIAEKVGPDSSVLISNMRKTSSDGLATFSGNKWAIRFTTGVAERAWRPTAIQLPITSWHEGATPAVALHQAGTGDEPGDKIAVLTNATAGSGIRTFTAPAGLTLESNTTYTIVLSGDGADASSAIEFGSTGDNGHDDGGADGWSFDDRSLQFSSDIWEARDARIRVTVLGIELSEWTQKERDCSAFNPSANDPLYGCQWHLNNTGHFPGGAMQDINVEEVWASGNLGEGINVAIVGRLAFTIDTLT